MHGLPDDLKTYQVSHFNSWRGQLADWTIHRPVNFLGGDCAQLQIVGGRHKGLTGASEVHVTAP